MDTERVKIYQESPKSKSGGKYKEFFLELQIKLSENRRAGIQAGKVLSGNGRMT